MTLLDDLRKHDGFVRGFMACIDEFRKQKAITVHSIQDTEQAIAMMKVLNNIESAIILKAIEVGKP